MKRLVLLLLILVACAPVEPETPVEPVSKPISQPDVTTTESVVSAPKKAPVAPVEDKDDEVPLSPVENIDYDIDPYSQLGCEQLLTAEQFAESCGKDAGTLVVTYRIGTRNCIVNIKDYSNERLTAGITLTGFSDAETAEEEYDRRLRVLKVGADKSVGERAYEFPKLDRQTINFLRDEFIVEVGADSKLCEEEGLYGVAKVVDAHLI